MSLLLLFYVCLTSCSSVAVPVIGVVTQPCLYYDINQCGNSSDVSYLPASYVEWIQMSGAETIPLFFTYTSTELDDILPQINGILITGGAASTNPISQYEKFIISILSKTRQYHLNHQQSIPIWGTCDGFENMLTAIGKGGESVLSVFNSTNINLPVIFDETTVGNSVMFDTNNKTSKYYPYTTMILNFASNENVTFNDHNKGINPTVFNEDEYLSTNFTPLGISYDRDNKPFITLMESKKELGLYLFASQFHPEKSEFEFDDNVIDHSYDAIITNTWFSQFFVNQCRGTNDNVMSENTLQSLSMYNYNPYYSGDYFEQIYTFEQ